MRQSSLERRINHEVRLGILGCLVDESLSLTALSARLGKPLAVVTYHLRVLEDRDVVERGDGLEDGLYAATLDGHPPWVAEAVADHKESDPARREALAAVRAKVGLKCDGCERLLRYKEQVVVVHEKDEERRASIVSGDSPGSGEAASPRAIEKYHRDCYAEARDRDPFLPPIQD